MNNIYDKDNRIYDNDLWINNNTGESRYDEDSYNQSVYSKEEAEERLIDLLREIR